MTKPPTIAVSFLLFFQILFTITVTSYSPVDHFGVNCGNSDNPPSSDHRNWTGDIGSTLFSLIEPNNGNHSVRADSPVSKIIPYNTVRLSCSEFSYSFPVTHGPKFIRLYFYLSSYLDFFRSDSLFSVKIRSHTLLKDFNASFTAADTSEETILREYCINVEPGQRLNITFTPSLSHPNTYAFINGIEIVSMPTYLYYTNPDNLQAMLLNGGTQQFPVMNSSALQTVYRINVGGSQIPPEKDTGMFRYWDEDIDYLERERPYSVSVGFRLKPNYMNDQNYFAPGDVYMTARNYGMKETSKYNVTWEFQVDSDFVYMVRLHFCEFDQNVQKTGRVFQIFIADTLAERLADVLMWSGNTLIHVHKDYAMSTWNQGGLKKVNISIKLQPHPTARSTYRDVLLNGIEILKLTDYSDNPRQSPLLPSSTSSKNAKIKRVISIVVGAASGFAVLPFIVWLIFWRLSKDTVNKGSSWWRQKSIGKSKANKSNGPPLPSDFCRCFSIVEIREATNNFDDSFIVGIGGFGNVYKGHIDHGTIPVAIKRLKQGSQQGLREFQTEIEMLSQLRHLHLVSLIGYCNDGNEMILVYEFMEHGTLRDHLYDSENQPLSWSQRLEICLGAARGLHFLHTSMKHAIIHPDIKTTNIVIDENWVAKISDFGLSKVGPSGISRSNINISTVVKGSIGYLDPEYFMCQRLTEKSDVYSFGVVLLEVLCGRPPILRTVERQRQNLVEWLRRCVNAGEIHRVVDPFMRESMTIECLNAFTKIALKCLVDDGNERPSMGYVMLGLESVTEMLKNAEGATLGGTQGAG